MKSLKVVFFGTPEFAKTCLEKIHNSEHQVVGVVTAPDKASGRGQKVSQSAVKQYAVENHLSVFQPEKLRRKEFLDQIKGLNADVFVVVAFRMMPKVLFEIPPLGCFNLHASLLPDYRGAAPINFAIINGETKTGVTTFFIDEKIDEGNILLQASTDIHPEENAGELHDRLQILGADLILKTLDGLAEGTLTEKPQQQQSEPKNAFKIFKEDTKINWEQPSEKINDFIRGMSPYPAAFTRVNMDGSEKSLKIFSGRFELDSHNNVPGSCNLTKNSLEIYTTDGIYFPQELQLEGKKRMDIKSFLNGLKPETQIRIVN